MRGLPIAKRAPTLALAAILAAAALGADEARTVRVGLFPAAPLVFERDSKPQGLFIDVIERIGRERRWRIEYVRGTWNELLKALADGSIDVSPAVGFTEAGPGYSTSPSARSSSIAASCSPGAAGRSTRSMTSMGRR